MYLGVMCRGHYNMSRSKENYSSSAKSQFIQYLYQEGVRKGVHKEPRFYPQILEFIQTPEGQKAFSQFNQMDKKRFGFTVQPISTFKKAYP
jgi:hypothetical protein